MITKCDTWVLPLGPIVELLNRIEYADGYWTLSTRHRHEHGLLTDCRARVYENLTHGELIDVLDVHMAELAPLGVGPSRWQLDEDPF